MWWIDHLKNAEYIKTAQGLLIQISIHRNDQLDWCLYSLSLWRNCIFSFEWFKIITEEDKSGRTFEKISVDISPSPFLNFIIFSEVVATDIEQFVSIPCVFFFFFSLSFFIWNHLVCLEYSIWLVVIAIVLHQFSTCTSPLPDVFWAQVCFKEKFFHACVF